jgi:hypothetical protein
MDVSRIHTYLKVASDLREHEDLSDSAKSDLAGVLSRRLFHRCMSILTRPLRRKDPHPVTDPDGIIRMVLYVLIAYIADLEEQLWIATLMTQSCPHCVTRKNQLDCDECREIRTSAWILDKIRLTLDTLATVNGQRGIETPLQFLYESKKHGLCGVKKPFWVDLDIDICTVLSLDLLHGYYKFFYDHVFHWNRNILGHSEIDARLASQIQLVGDRVFPQGVSRISQMTGKEHRDLLRVHIAIVAGGSNNGNSKLTQATRSIVDCIYLAQYEKMTETDVKAYERSYGQVQQLRQIWIDCGGQRGKNGVIEHFEIPKFHNIRHLPAQVFAKGPLDNYSTETMERMHGDLKNAYDATNRCNWAEQAVKWLMRRERILGFATWLEHSLEKQKQGIGLDINQDDLSLSPAPTATGPQGNVLKPHFLTQHLGSYCSVAPAGSVVQAMAVAGGKVLTKNGSSMVHDKRGDNIGT